MFLNPKGGAISWINWATLDEFNHCVAFGSNSAHLLLRNEKFSELIHLSASFIDSWKPSNTTAINIFKIRSDIITTKAMKKGVEVAVFPHWIPDAYSSPSVKAWVTSHGISWPYVARSQQYQTASSNLPNDLNKLLSNEPSY